LILLGLGEMHDDGQDRREKDRVATGEVLHQLRPQHRAAEFRKFLRPSTRRCPPASRCTSCWTTPRPTRPTPSTAGWWRTRASSSTSRPPPARRLNLVERWFAELTRRLLQRSAHKTVKALTTDLNAWIATWNDSPRPFVWHKSADEILENLQRYLQRISDA
jgi:hypothetical protein